MIEEYYRNWLLDDPKINVEIGDRFFPQSVPKNSALPAVSYSMISDQATLELNGVSNTRHPRFQLSIIAESQVDAARVSEAIKKRTAAWVYEYPDMKVSSCFAEGNIYLSLDYYTPQRFGVMIEAFINYVLI
jgi:hypothetical protein